MEHKGWDANERAETRLKEFRKGCDADMTRRKREEAASIIRKNKREERLFKKRKEASAEATPQISASLQAKLDKLPEMVAAMAQPDTETQYQAVRFVRRILSVEKKPPINTIVDAGVIPYFVAFLDRDDAPKLQFESAWALTNIASGTSDQTRLVVNSGCVPKFVRLLRSPDPDCREQSVWALGNIAGDGTELREFVLRHDVLKPTLAMLAPDTPPEILRNAVWAMSNFCRNCPDTPEFNSAVPLLQRMIFSEDEDILSDSLTALSYLTDSNPTTIAMVCEPRTVKRLVQLLLVANNQVVIPALRIIGNIVTGDENQTQTVLNCNVLPSLAALLNSPKKTIKKEATWTISNITAGSTKQIQAVIDHQIIPMLVFLLNTADWDVRKEAAWAISNTTCGTPEQVKYVISCGAIKPLVDLLKEDDPKILIITLEGIDNVLRIGQAEAKGGINEYASAIEDLDAPAIIERLQRHVNPGVYQRAQSIITTYFAEETDEDDADIAPKTDTTTGTLQFTAQSSAAPPPPPGAPAPTAPAAPFSFSTTPLSASPAPTPFSFGVPPQPQPGPFFQAPGAAPVPAFPPPAVPSPAFPQPVTPSPAFQSTTPVPTFPQPAAPAPAFQQPASPFPGASPPAASTQGPFSFAGGSA